MWTRSYFVSTAGNVSSETVRLAIFCKSYSRDVRRVKRLLASIELHNQAALPVFISIPQIDRKLFENQLGLGRCSFIDDEEIAATNPNYSWEKLTRLPGGLYQQIIKSEFWRIGNIANYLCIDSDSYFITDFNYTNFLHPDGNPYTVIHQNRELLQMAINLGMNKIQSNFEAECQRFARIFNRPVPDYYFMPSPFLWSAKVWQSLVDNYLAPRNLSITDAITSDLPESRWYGEALLAYQAIPLHPIEPLFRVYHYDWQYFSLRRQGGTEAKLAKNYLGVIYQSNWNWELDYGAPQKSWASRVLRRIKRAARRLIR